MAAVAARAKVVASITWEVTTRALWAAKMSAPITVRRATRPVSAVRRKETRHTKSTWPREKRRSKAFSWLTESSSSLHQTCFPHKHPTCVATSTSKNIKCSPILEWPKREIVVDGSLTPVPQII
jgi:hypothetical protein